MAQEIAVLAGGCFWGVQSVYNRVKGVKHTVAGYSGGTKDTANYGDVSSERTGHAESLKIVFDPQVVSYDVLLKVFWENHNPTQGMRQGNDVGTQYRSAIYTFSDEQAKAVEASEHLFQERLNGSGFGDVTTEVAASGPFYYAEDYHQQYLEKNPGGYCGLGGTGVSCPVGVESLRQ